MSQPKSPETIAASHGVATDSAYGAVTPPLYLSTTFAFPGYEKPGAYDYGRSGNPNRDMLGDALARLEGGAGAVVTASGMAAIDLVLGRLRPGDLLVAPHDCYGGTQRLFLARAERGHFDLAFVDQSDGAALQAVLDRRPALVFIETPSNPLMRVVDIRAIAAAAHAAGAKVAVDNTFLSPALQRPIALGADFVVHSTTKYLNGHSDVVGGAVVAADADEAAALRAWANVTGAVGSPFDAWLTLRGLRTLFPRMAQQARNADAVARFLAGHPKVAAVHYPGLESHPSHAVARAQQSGYGAMLSFDLAGGTAAVKAFVGHVRVFVLAESLGGVESLVAHPATMTHADMGAEARHGAGIGDSLLRLSVGLENEADLIAGLEAGLAACPA
ncbi:MAG: O-succinylhomoserine (thiol)-lyase [Sphingomonas sp. SCN 67-18]|uniref:cystathionine gamma-synthase n=1 Tax=uncultured Sphingomonas sp. TaxID=158754 RepID=UPI00086E09E4|nr:cystathionine gamma-synthase [Sphingomonas sp. SCN 67-18]ODU20958.1 MAG: O-succinylhomoserine (thiol)-lyase [Sphingomonas sp. SCN 67-18]